MPRARHTVNFEFPLLLAGMLEEILRIVVPLVFLLIWVISQMTDAKKKLAKPPRQPAMPPPGPAVQPPGMALPQPAGDPLRAQVDEFLRRAGRQAAPAQQRPAVRHDEIEVLLGDEPAAPAHRPLAEPLRPMGEAATAPQPAMPPRQGGPRRPRRAGPPRPESVADHVATHVDAAVEQIREEVSQLGQAVITADQQFDVQLQQKFDHELGTLGPSRAARILDQQPQKPAETPASQIAAMLANPDGVRQAIIVNEILRRPDVRW